MFLSRDTTIAEAKLTQYLLVPLIKDDKSKFPAKADYTLDNWQQLEQDLRSQVLTKPAELVETNRYGSKYSIRALLRGGNGVEIDILTIWMVSGDTTSFVTLVPDKGVN